MTSSHIYPFGSGILYGVRTDQTTPTPYVFGTLQEVQIELSQTVKELYGRKQFPVDTARGTGKITGKAKLGEINGKAFADLFFNVSVTTGQTQSVDGESQTVPGSPYTVAVTNALTYSEDLGVVFSSTGLPLTKVASAPAAGQYSCPASGSYTFAAADTTKAMLISYRYTIAGTGQQMTITNQDLGTSPTFKIVLKQLSKTNSAVFVLNQCISTKLTLPTKLEDYTINDFEFAAFGDDSNNIGGWSMNSPV